MKNMNTKENREFLGAPISEETFKKYAPLLGKTKNDVALLHNRLGPDSIIGDLLITSEGTINFGVTVLYRMNEMLDKYGLSVNHIGAQFDVYKDTGINVLSLPAQNRLDYYMRTLEVMPDVQKYSVGTHPGRIKDFMLKPLSVETIMMSPHKPYKAKHATNMMQQQFGDDLVMGDLVAIQAADILRLKGIGRGFLMGIEKNSAPYGLSVGMLVYSKDHKFKKFDDLRDLPAEQRVDYYIKSVQLLAANQKIDQINKKQEDFVGTSLDFNLVSKAFPEELHSTVNKMFSTMLHSMAATYNQPLIAGDLLLYTSEQFVHMPRLGKKSISIIEKLLLAQNLQVGLLNKEFGPNNSQQRYFMDHNRNSLDIMQESPENRAAIYRAELARKGIESGPVRPAYT